MTAKRRRYGCIGVFSVSLRPDTLRAPRTARGNCALRRLHYRRRRVAVVRVPLVQEIIGQKPGGGSILSRGCGIDDQISVAEPIFARRFPLCRRHFRYCRHLQAFYLFRLCIEHRQFSAPWKACLFNDCRSGDRSGTLQYLLTRLTTAPHHCDTRNRSLRSLYRLFRMEMVGKDP